MVSIIDIYENTFHDVKCLLMVCEFMEGGDLLTQFENQSSKPYTEESKKSQHIFKIQVKVHAHETRLLNEWGAN